MGCDCDCLEKLNKIGIHGCCFKCEADHDFLRNALHRNGELLRAVHNVRLAYCQAACKNPPLGNPSPSEHTAFCTEVSNFILAPEKTKENP